MSVGKMDNARVKFLIPHDKRENIENSRICTQCDPDRFFSHRVMGAKRGTLAGFMSL